PIVRIRQASLHETNAHRAEVQWTHHVAVGRRGVRSHPFGLAANLRDVHAIVITTEWNETREADALDAWCVAKLRGDLRIEACALETVETRLRQCERHREQMTPTNSRLHPKHTGKALDHQRTRREQHDGKRELHDGQRGPRASRRSRRRSRRSFAQRALWVSR